MQDLPFISPGDASESAPQAAGLLLPADPENNWLVKPFIFRLP
ncbi:hypothetical protein [Erwinia psidii]|nr:hypothetical protein [Erwinia psidii]